MKIQKFFGKEIIILNAFISCLNHTIGLSNVNLCD